MNCYSDLEKSLVNAVNVIEENKLSKNISKYNDIVKQVISYLNRHFSEEIKLKDVSDMLYINTNYLSIIFKKTMGKTFSQYLTEIRMKEACELLNHTAYSIEEVCGKVGYTDYYSFIKAFKKINGITPGKFKRDAGT